VTQIVTPRADEVREILRESHALWGSGLALEPYLSMWAELAATPWGRDWFSWRALVDDRGRVLSSLKLYRPRIRMGAEEMRACGLGAVFTPRSQRRRGHASTLLRGVLDESRRDGNGPGLLFTDIGTAYYEALGFRALPCEDVLGSLKGIAEAPRGVRLRPMNEDDLDAVLRAHDASCASRPFAVLRDRSHWTFLLDRAAAFFRRLDGTGLGRRFMIAEDGGRATGYLVGVEGPGEWNLREAGSFDGDPEVLSRILGAGAAQARAAGATDVWGWLPRSWWSLVPSWRLRPQPRPRAIPMIRMTDGEDPPSALDSVEGAFLPYLEQF